MRTIFARIFNYAGRDLRVWHGDDPPPIAQCPRSTPWLDSLNNCWRFSNGTQFVKGNEFTVTEDDTAGNLDITPAMVINGLLERDPNGGNRTDALPDADDLVAAVSGPYVGQVLDFLVVNTAAAANTVTITAGADGTMKPATPAAIAQNQARLYKIILTNVTPGSEAYDVYAITGT